MVLTLVIDSGAVPVFVSVTVCELDVAPTAVGANKRLCTLTAPTAAPTAVPLRLTVSVPVEVTIES